MERRRPLKLEVSLALLVWCFRIKGTHRFIGGLLVKTLLNLISQSTVANAPAMSQPHAQQTPDLGILLDHFLRQVRGHHVVTPNRAPLPLHYDSSKELLVEWPWFVFPPYCTVRKF